MSSGFHQDDDYVYCENCDRAFESLQWVSVFRGYEQRETCPHCGAATAAFLSEGAQELGDYLLSVADDEWTCGAQRCYPALPRYEA